ncbi:cullin-4A [Trichonephila clavipes]|nr:cullin-4A [Trichonephila clavipes]
MLTYLDINRVQLMSCQPILPISHRLKTSRYVLLTAWVSIPTDEVWYGLKMHEMSWPSQSSEPHSAGCCGRGSRVGLGSNPGEDMDVCKCIVPLRHGGTLNSRRAASPLVRLGEAEERWEAPDPFHGVLPQNWGETELNSSVTCMVLKGTANDRRHLALCHDEIRGLDLAFADQYDFWHRTATAGSDVVQSGRPIFDDFFQHLWPYIGNNRANVVFQMVKRLWLIRIDQ